MSPVLPALKRAAVIVPPLHDFYFTAHRFSSLGARIVAGMLSRSGIPPSLFVFPLMDRGRAVPFSFPHLEPFMIESETGPVSFFTSLRRYGPSAESCAGMVAGARPDICFFSVFAFAYADDAIALARAVRDKLRKVPLVAGGAGPSSHPAYFLENGAFDFVLAGEAEASLQPFLGALAGHDPLSSVPNLWRGEAGAVRPPSVSLRPSPDAIEPAMAQSAETTRTITLSASLSRGCPKKCSFCSSRALFGDRLRTPSPGKIEAALARTVPSLAPGKRIIVNFEDDNLLADREFFFSVLGCFRRIVPGLRFVAENGIDHQFLTPGTAGRLVEAGFDKFNLSLATLDPALRAAGRRPVAFGRYEKVLDLLALKNIPSVTYFICGLRGETRESAARSLTYLAAKNTRVGISLFYPVPGLPGFEDLSRFGGTPSLLCLGAAAYPWNGSLSTATMLTAFRLGRCINLMKKPSRTEAENGLLSLIAGRGELYTFIKERRKKLKIMPVPGQDRELVRMALGKMV